MEQNLISPPTWLHFRKLNCTVLHWWLYNPVFPWTQKSPVSLEEKTLALHSASDVDTLSKHSQLLVWPCQAAALSMQVECRHSATLRTELLLSSAQPGQQEEAELPPHPWLIQAVPSAVRSQAYESHPGSPVLFPSLIPSLQSVPNAPITEESHLLDGPQTSQELTSPRVDGQHAGSIFNSSNTHNAEPWNLFSQHLCSQDYQVPSLSPC